MIPDLRYFEWSEFACKHCGENHTNPGSAERIDRARHFAGIPFNVNSAYRCPAHNEAVGSRSDVHPRGHAFDISATDSRTRHRVIEGMRKAGFTRIGVAKTFIHADDDPAKAPEVTWVYD